MDVRTTFIIAIGVLLFAMYYLEKEMKKEQIFWLFAVLSVLFGVAGVYAVAKKQNYDYYIFFAVLSVLMAVLYYGEPEKEVEAASEKKKRKK